MGTICICSKLFEAMPMMKPKRQKLVAISTRNAIIASGCWMCSGTKNDAVVRMIEAKHHRFRRGGADIGEHDLEMTRRARRALRRSCR